MDLGRVDGKRRRRTFYGETRRAVQEQLAPAVAARVGGDTSSGRTQTLAAFLSRWIEDAPVRTRTRDHYRLNLERHVVPTLGRIPLQKLTAQHVNALLQAKMRAGLSPQSVHHVRAVLRNALGRAMKWNLIARNPAALADPPRVEQYQAAYLTVDGARAFLEAAKGDRLEALYSVALGLGLRQGEALGLSWPDVDLDTGTLRVSHSLQRIKGGGLQLLEPKTRQSRRALAMPESLTRQLRAHRARQLEERVFAGDLWQDSGLVFTTLQGRPLGASHVVNGSFRRIARAAGAPAGLRFHDLRHSCASLLLAQGVAARTVMDVLGHSTIAMTARYQHVASALMGEAAKAMDRALGS
ncbi:MAG: site-specific integrase [Chloroflexota bacterium]|nr:site-specific integrase [Chloroflexota bacterium]